MRKREDYLFLLDVLYRRVNKSWIWGLLVSLLSSVAVSYVIWRWLKEKSEA